MTVVTIRIREEMRASVLAGRPRSGIARRFGVSKGAVYYHTRDIQIVQDMPCSQARARAGLRFRAERLERLFTDCNRALALRGA